MGAGGERGGVRQLEVNLVGRLVHKYRRRNSRELDRGRQLLSRRCVIVGVIQLEIDGDGIVGDEPLLAIDGQILDHPAAFSRDIDEPAAQRRALA